MANVNGANQKEKDKWLELAYNSLIDFGRLFLPDDFLYKSQSPPFHYIVAKKLVDTKPGARLCNVMPRGFGKSILAKAAILWKICFGKQNNPEFIAWISEEQSQAIDHIRFIKHHLELNEKIMYYFGDLSGESVGNTWTMKDFTTSKGDRIIGKGTTQKLRGRAELSRRYTGIVLDDFESELNTKTPERRADIKNWIAGAVFPALEESKGNEGWIWLQGTIVHFDSYLQSIVDGYMADVKAERKSPWDLNFYRATSSGTLDGEPLWGEQFPIWKLRNKLNGEYRDNPDKFYQEYMNDARDITNAKFKIGKLNYYDGEFIGKDGFMYLVTDKEAIPINVYIGVDLAYEDSAGHDYQVIMPIGIDRHKNVYIGNYFHDRIPLHAMPMKIYDYSIRHQPVKRVNIEKVGAQGVIKDYVLQLAANDRRVLMGATMGIKPPHGIKKNDRIESGVCDIVNSGKMYIKRNHEALKNEMFQFPKGAHDDLLDALWYALKNSRAPTSKAMNIDEFQVGGSRPRFQNVFRRRISWMTGQPIK